MTQPHPARPRPPHALEQAATSQAALGEHHFEETGC